MCHAQGHFIFLTVLLNITFVPVSVSCVRDLCRFIVSLCILLRLSANLLLIDFI